MKRYDLNLLAALEALLIEPSVSAAARRMRIGQPAMSSALSRLRVLFADPLFVRTTRGMEPTERARALEEPLRKALAELRSLIEPDLTFDPTTSKRAFQLSGGDYAGMTILPPLMQILAQEAPGIAIRFRYVEKSVLLELLDRDEVDLGLAVMTDLPNRFRAKSVLEETFVCAVRANHPILDAPLTLETFAKIDHLLVTERGDERGYIDELLATKGLSRHIAITVPSAALVAGILRHSDLIATIPRRAGDRISEDSGLALIELPHVAKAWTMSMIWTERNSRDPGLIWLRQKIAAAAGHSMAK